MVCQIRQAHAGRTFNIIITSRRVRIEIIVSNILHCALKSTTRDASESQGKGEE